MKQLFLAACLLAVTVEPQTRTGTVTGTWQSDVRNYSTQDNERLVSVQLERDGDNVDADLVRDLQAHGFTNMSEEDLVDFAIHGRRWLRKRA